jgi:hypothetical protein
MSTIAGLMILIALIALFLVVFMAFPVLAIALLICAFPAWAMTEMAASRRHRRGGSMSGLEKALRIAGLTIAIPVVLITALGIALFTLCAFMQG